MASLESVVLGVFLVFASLEQSLLVHASYRSDFSCIWGPKNLALWNFGENMALSLTNVSGCGIRSNSQFMYGSIEMHIKLVGGNSAGSVTTYYMSSTGAKHDEIDFEFLGNVSGQPYIIHTNIYTQGVGNREVQFYPWFNPTTDFHNYTIHWNPSQVVWLIDSIPIRVYKNYQSRGIAFPSQQAMNAYSSIWNGDDWATRGGLVKIDWRRAPFIARYQGLKLRACRWYGAGSTKQCSASTQANWWTAPAYAKLSNAQQAQLIGVRSKYLVYDYCKDGKRFNWTMPPECSLPMF